jgi:hypothetical protein
MPAALRSHPLAVFAVIQANYSQPHLDFGLAGDDSATQKTAKRPLFFCCFPLF